MFNKNLFGKPSKAQETDFQYIEGESFTFTEEQSVYRSLLNDIKELNKYDADIHASNSNLSNDEISYDNIIDNSKEKTLNESEFVLSDEGFLSDEGLDESNLKSFNFQNPE